jgi:hypothetical protein
MSYSTKTQCFVTLYRLSRLSRQVSISLELPHEKRVIGSFRGKPPVYYHEMNSAKCKNKPRFHHHNGAGVALK